MAYDLALASRLKAELKDYPVTEKKMFGGVGYLLNGNMLCGVHSDNLIVRAGPARYSDCLTRPHTKPFEMTGHPMTGWVEVLPDGIFRDEELDAWIKISLEFNKTLPIK